MKLTEYDTKHAKAGDSVLVAYQTLTRYVCMSFARVTSVSPKRGQITLSDGRKFDSCGYEIGSPNRYDFYVDNAEAREFESNHTARAEAVRDIREKIHRLSIGAGTEFYERAKLDDLKRLNKALRAVLWGESEG